MLAVIGGTGLNQLEGLQIERSEAFETAWGAPSGKLQFGRFADLPILFLARHGEGHHLAPHRINYRANIAALKQAGASDIIAVNAVGGISASWPPAAVGLPDQLIDYSWGRAHTFSGTEGEPLQHIEFTQPFSPELRQELLSAAERSKAEIVAQATLAVTQGPRLETAAEITKYERDGCHIVGMTSMPEAALARELALPYAAIAVSVNWAAGRGPDTAPGAMHAQIEQSITAGMATVRSLLLALLEQRSRSSVT